MTITVAWGDRYFHETKSDYRQIGYHNEDYSIFRARTIKIASLESLPEQTKQMVAELAADCLKHTGERFPVEQLPKEYRP